MQRPPQHVESHLICGGELDDEDVLLRRVVVGAEVQLERVRQDVQPRVDDAVRGVARGLARVPGAVDSCDVHTGTRVVAGRVDPRSRAFARIHPGIQIQVRQERIDRASGNVPAGGNRGGPRQVRPDRQQLRLDELERRVPGRARPLLDLDRGGERQSPEHVHQEVIVEGAEIAGLAFDLHLVRDRRVLQRVEQHVGPRHAGVGVVPHVVQEAERGWAARRPELAVLLEPRAVVVPVRAAGRHDHLVGGDLTLAPVVALADGAPQLGVYACEGSPHFALGMEEVPGRDSAGRGFAHVRAALQGHQEERGESHRSDRRRHKESLHRSGLLRTRHEGRP